MATVGSWGREIIFSTNDSRILTFNDFTRNVSGSWANHSRIGLKDRTEFIRPELQTVTFTMTLDATFRIKPRSTLDILAAAVETGKINWLVIGGKTVGSRRWKIKSTSEAWDYFLNKGELVRAKVNVTMEEYL